MANYWEQMSQQPTKEQIRKKLESKQEPRVEIEQYQTRMKGSITKINESPNGPSYDTFTIILDGGGEIDAYLSKIKKFI